MQAFMAVKPKDFPKDFSLLLLFFFNYPIYFFSLEEESEKSHIL